MSNEFNPVGVLRHRLEGEKGKLALLQEQAFQAAANIVHYQGLREQLEKAQVVLQTVAQQTQEELRYYISDLVSLALDSIFDQPYTFELEFVQRRGRTEADMYLARDGNRVSPEDAVGGGVTDLIGLALRVSLWSMTKHTRNVLLLDEPFKFLHSREMQQRASELLKHLSQQLGLQIIMVTGEDESPEIVAQADRVFRVSMDKGVSSVTEEA